TASATTAGSERPSHRRTRDRRVAGEPFAAGDSSAARNSATPGKRSAGERASAVATARETAGGTSGRLSPNGGASARKRWASADSVREPGNGGAPASISYSTHARLYSSLRASTGSPDACSGLM